MKKGNSSVSQLKLFRDPVPYLPITGCSKTIVFVLDSSSSPSVIKQVCVEDVMSSLIPLSFEECTLSNLVDKGIDTHALDLIDSSKLGCDAGAESLAREILSNSDKYVESSK